MGVSAFEVIVQLFNERASVQIHELLSQNSIHGCCISCVAPERVVYGCEHDIPFCAFQCGVHHVSGIQGVDEVRWESCILFLFVYWLIIKVIDNIDSL